MLSPASERRLDARLVDTPSIHTYGGSVRRGAHADPALESLPAQVARRLLEMSVAGLVLLLAAVPMLLLAALIRLDSPGPALFWQPRMTRDRRSGRDRRAGPRADADPDRRQTTMAGRPFRFVKFRTMYVDARARFPELYAYQYTDAQLETLKFKVDPDPRLTRVGRFLRKTSLDELPNFWNVLTGDIALVGPRPEIPEMSPYYRGLEQRKFSVKPGVTGLAQINGRGRLLFRETITHDLEYVDSRTLGLDLRVLWRTLVAVIRHDGAF